MPHKVNLRNSRMRIFEKSLGLTMDTMKIIKGKTLKEVAAKAKMKRNLLASLASIEADKELYEFGPLQLEAIKRLKQIIRKAKTPEDLARVDRLSCYLKLPKR